MVKATNFKPKTETKKLWCGLYGGHYDVIVFFKKKPILSKEEHCAIDGQWYDCMDNEKLIVGDMSLDRFYEVYPDADLTAYTQDNGRPLEVEIPEVFQMEITACFDKSGRMESINFHEDSW